MGSPLVLNWLRAQELPSVPSIEGTRGSSSADCVRIGSHLVLDWLRAQELPSVPSIEGTGGSSSVCSFVV